MLNIISNSSLNKQIQIAYPQNKEDIISKLEIISEKISILFELFTDRNRCINYYVNIIEALYQDGVNCNSTDGTAPSYNTSELLEDISSNYQKYKYYIPKLLAYQRTSYPSKDLIIENASNLYLIVHLIRQYSSMHIKIRTITAFLFDIFKSGYFNTNHLQNQKDMFTTPNNFRTNTTPEAPRLRPRNFFTDTVGSENSLYTNNISVNNSLFDILI